LIDQLCLIVMNLQSTTLASFFPWYSYERDLPNCLSHVIRVEKSSSR